MKFKHILFDLDGTLLPLNQLQFTNKCFELITQSLQKYGYTMEMIALSTKAMTINDGTLTNEEVFWKELSKLKGQNIDGDKKHFDYFYQFEFDNIKSICGYNKLFSQLLKDLKNKGYTLSIATSPLFPLIAIKKRIKWAGLNPSDFYLITSYENSHYCKPNLKYYEEVLQKLNAKPEECLMIGNDMTEDMIAKELGINVFLLTDCLINNNNQDINIPNGDINDLIKYLND